MQVKDIMSKKMISVDPEDNLSIAISKMKKNNLHQLLVMSKDNFYGMIELKRVVSRDVNASITKVSSLATNVPHIDAEDSLENASKTLLSAATHALPVTENGKVVGVISESDMMKAAKQYVRGLNQSASEIASPAEYLKKNDNYGHLRHILYERNISRVPVIDEKKIIGVVGTLDMIKVMEGKERLETRGGLLQEKGAKEKIRLDETIVSTIMRPALIVQGNKTISDVIEMLQTNDEIIIQTDTMVGIITPKDILELFASAPSKQLYVQITGMHEESIEFKVKMDQVINEFVQKVSKMVPNIEYLVVHVEKMHKQGPRQKYSIRLRFKVPFGLFIAHAWGWKSIDVIQDAFRKLDKEVMKKHQKIADTTKMKRMRIRGK